MMEDQKTKIWQKYENGLDYLRKKNLFTETEKNWDFYNGNQWKGIQSGGEQFPVENFIKPIVKYKVATIAQNAMTAVYSDMEDRTDYVDACRTLGKMFTKNWERAKMDYRSWEVILSAAVQGDSYLYFGTENVKDVQVIINTNIMFGDEQEASIQRQPYIVIAERKLVSKIIEEAKQNGVPKSEYELITGDEEKERQIGNREEVHGSDKCTSILYMEKDENGIVNVARSTKCCVYEPLHPISGSDSDGNPHGGLKSYPIVNMIWEKVPNSARGISEVKQLIPNQLELNKTLARRSMSVKMTAFPRIAYDATAIQDPEALELVGAAIGLQGAAGNVDTMIKYLNPASMSHDAQNLQSDLLINTRELAGAGDAATGNIDPEKASGAAIQAVRDQSELPLNDQVTAYKQFTEDLAMLWFDMACAYSPNGLTFRFTDDTGEEQEGTVTPEQLEEIKPDVRIDVSKDNSWSKYAEQQELANHLNANHITFEEYVEVLPDNSALPKNKMLSLIEKRKTKMEEQKQQTEAGSDEEYLKQMLQMQGQGGQLNV